jgi:hypothetical protein
MDNELSKDTAMFLLAVMSIILMVLMGMGDSVILALVATLAMVYIVDTAHLRRVFGYLAATDILFSVWLASLASATLGGLTMAIAAGLMYTVISRELRSAWGAERLSVNNDTGFGKIAAHCTTWLVQYARNSFTALMKGTKVDAPEALEISWHEVIPAGGFLATRTMDAIKWVRGLIIPAPAFLTA